MSDDHQDLAAYHARQRANMLENSSSEGGTSLPEVPSPPGSDTQGTRWLAKVATALALVALGWLLRGLTL